MAPDAVASRVCVGLNRAIARPVLSTRKELKFQGMIWRPSSPGWAAWQHQQCEEREVKDRGVSAVLQSSQYTPK